MGHWQLCQLMSADASWDMWGYMFKFGGNCWNMLKSIESIGMVSLDCGGLGRTCLDPEVQRPHESLWLQHAAARTARKDMSSPTTAAALQEHTRKYKKHCIPGSCRKNIERLTFSQNNQSKWKHVKTQSSSQLFLPVHSSKLNKKPFGSIWKLLLCNELQGLLLQNAIFAFSISSYCRWRCPHPIQRSLRRIHHTAIHHVRRARAPARTECNQEQQGFLAIPCHSLPLA